MLINNESIQDEEQLRVFETVMTMERLAQLRLNPISGRFDLKHLQQIHRYIFQDVYPFAGKIRSEEIAKGHTQFARCQFIAEQFEHLHGELTRERFLKDKSRENFAERAAYYMAEMNIIHPFREGNGRTQREYMRCLAKSAGFTLDWDKVDKERVFDAFVKSVFDSSLLSQVILDCIES
ncbi:MAG: Fic family protein [Alicyclobacillus sp.]|nr:Fic family protein [Alicyclobacillus sp.]